MTGKKRPKQTDEERERQREIEKRKLIGKTCNSGSDRDRKREPHTPSAESQNHALLVRIGLVVV